MTNRIPLIPAAETDPSGLVMAGAQPSPEAVDTALYVSVSGAQPLSLFAPLHYEPKYAYPLIVWLHGNGDTEQQLRRIMPEVSLRNFVAVGVRGPRATTAASGRPGYGWSSSRADVAWAERGVFDAIATAADRYHINPHRIFLAGFDAGGTMALRLALAQPREFGGVVSLLGKLPDGRAPLACWPDLRGLPVLLAAGRKSQQYPTTAVCADMRLLHTAGVNFTLREYPVGHALAPVMLADMNRWIMELVAGAASAR